MNHWSGNSQATWATLGASNHSNSTRHNDDYYATDPAAIPPLLSLAGVAELNWPVYEPACGEGHISKTLKDMGFQVVSSDLIDRGYGLGGVDFLDIPYLPDTQINIVTNPPYKYGLEFVQHALNLVGEGRMVAMFLKLTFLEGQKRRAFFDEHPPCIVAVFSKRQKCAKGGNFKGTPSSAACYAWFIWRKGYKGSPQITWI